MDNDKHQLNELPGSLGGIVAGIVAEPVPEDLKEHVRSRVSDRFNPRPARARAKTYLALTVAISMLAAIVAAVVFIPPSSRTPIDSNVVTVEIVTQPAQREVLPDRRAFAKGPSLWAYHRAANDSLDRLDGLLAEHAALVLTSGHSITRQADPYTTSRFLGEL